MRFMVVWDRTLERPALETWLHGSDDGRDRLNAIATVLNFALTNDPDRVGDPVEGEPDVRGWSTTAGPLPFYVQFRLKPADRQVEVLRITFPPKP